MASTGVNVLRYSALGAGIFYGFYHQASIKSSAKLAAVQREYQHKQSLIEKAKGEFAKTQPKPPKVESGDVIRDPTDSRFDLEAYLNVLSKEKA